MAIKNNISWLKQKIAQAGTHFPVFHIGRKITIIRYYLYLLWHNLVKYIKVWVPRLGHLDCLKYARVGLAHQKPTDKFFERAPMPHYEIQI